MFQIDPIPAFADNYIWALHTAEHCAIVDPGDATPVIKWLDAHRLLLSAILITHHHADHVGGIADLRRRYGDVPVYGPAAEKIPERTVALREGDHVAIAEIGKAFTVWEVPGHTLGHIAFIADGFALVGDTLFAAGCGRLFEGTPAQMHHSLARLAALPDATQIYCTHEYTLSNLRFALAVEPENDALVQRAFDAEATRARGIPTVPFAIAIERETNPFLRAHLPALAVAAASHMRRPISNAVASFAALREWKNNFQ